MPLFLFAHSMGCQILNTYLLINPDIAARLAGVIWSAPFWGIPAFAGVDWVKKQVIKLLALQLEEFVLVTGMPAHKVCRSKIYHRELLC